MDTTINGYKVTIYNDDVIIWNSHTIKFKEIKEFIQSFSLVNIYSEVLKQDKSILCAELFVHNLLYKLHILRNNTAHCNLSLYKDLTIIEKIVYKLISKLY